MNNVNNTVNPLNSFRDGFDQFPKWLQRSTREKLMDRCGWKSRITFYSKMNGKVSLRPPERAIVRELFAKHNINAFTGEQLENIEASEVRFVEQN
jgi:hypothetical protein